VPSDFPSLRFKSSHLPFNFLKSALTQTSACQVSHDSRSEFAAVFTPPASVSHLKLRLDV